MPKIDHPLRILQVVHQFLPDHVGGIEIYVQNLSQRLEDSGALVRVFCGNGLNLYAPASVLRSIGELRTVQLHDTEDAPEKKFSFFRTFRNRAVLECFKKTLLEFRPHVIHIHHTLYLSGELIFIAKQQGIPVVLTLHDYWFLCHKLHMVDSWGNQCSGPRGSAKCALCFLSEKKGALGLVNACLLGMPLLYRTRYQKKVLDSADFLVVPAGFFRDILSRYLKSVQKIRIIPYGISTPQTPHSPGLSISKPIRFAYLGTIKPHKGIDILIDAFNALAPEESACLDIYGHVKAGDKYGLEMLQKCHEGRIRFRGSYNNQNVETILKRSDVVIVPSIWRETGPLVALEALANGRPVIASNLGGMAEIIQEGENGFLFTPGNRTSLLERIRAILRRPSILENLTIRLKPKYHIDQNVRSVMDLYEHLV